MKKRFLLFGLIFALMTVVSQAQIYEMYSQDFETGTPVNYTVQCSSSSSAGAPQSTIYSGGSRAMRLLNVQSAVNYMYLDTIDFSQNALLRFYTLEFQHIAFVSPLQLQARTEGCIIEARRPSDPEGQWIQLSSTHYNMVEGGSTEFISLGSFSREAYGEWTSATSANNLLWKSERFDLDALLQGLAVVEKKLIIRFKVTERAAATGSEAWYIDDIKVRASHDQIVAPIITMRAFPDYINYPSSRGAKLIADVTTTATQGIDGGQVFCVYQVGNRTTYDTTYLSRESAGSNRFVGRIPFYGYDTLMHYHIVAKDSTTNANTSYFPKNSSQWKTYRCVRGKTNTAQPDQTGASYNSGFPFPTFADNRSEFIYDSVMMASMGFGPGYITNFRFILQTSPRNVTRPHLQFRMANKPYAVNRTSADLNFTSDAMQIPYDASFTIEQAAAGSYKMVTLQDTFFYGGGDLVIQTYYDGNVNVTAHSVRDIPAPNNKQSLWMFSADGAYDFNAFGADADQFQVGEYSPRRPWVQFYETKNVPLIYDAGVCAMAYPNYNTPCNTGTDSVVVWLKNYGDSVLYGDTIYYSIDNGAPVSYYWTGTLNGGDSVRVVVSTNQTFTIGYHTISAWTRGLLTSTLHLKYLDHEPYNDSTSTPFTACNGPYSGTLTIGSGSSNDFTSLERCLYVLSRCGVDGPTTVKLPAGNYNVTSFPFIPGTSESNYVLFEPATATAAVHFRRYRQGSTTNAPSLVDLSQAHSVRFKNINFYNGRYSDNRCNVLVQMGSNSLNCQFLNCSFIDSNTTAQSAQYLLRASNANNTLVQNCTFYGGTIGADVTGPAPDTRAFGNILRFNTFSDQTNTAIRVVNQNGVWVDSNYCNDVKTNASYVILGQYCYQGSKITRNKVFSSKGACCIGVSDFHGSATQYNLVANNMVVSSDDNTTNLLTTPLNIIKGSYMKVVFNSVRMNAPERMNIAAATFGGDIITNSYFQNNVIATFDTSNYAFSFIPGPNTDNLHVDHNCYYSVSGVLNKLSGVNYTNINAWRAAVPYDLGSVTGNPSFTNSGRVDLRSFSALLRNVGTPIPEVPNDLFGSVRNSVAPSLGAYEVTPLSVDFKPIGFVTPYENYCGANTPIPVEVIVANTGNGNYTYSAASPINVYYSIDNGAVQSFAMNQNFGPGDTNSYLSTRTMSLPSGTGNTDRTYSIRMWVRCNLDPDELNDTIVWTVNSRYAAPAPTVINQSVNYNTPAVVTPTAGVNTWPVSYYTSANGRQQRSGISWYYDDSDTSKFFYGPTLVTTPLHSDTTFYISQKRNLPLVKITEVQVNRTANGHTEPMPSWMNTGNFAIELTNCGDYPADLEGDSIIVVQPTAAAKIWVLPAVTVQPGENLVLQFRTSTTATDSTRTICAPSTAVVSPAYTANFGVIYRDGHGVADAVAFNNVISTPSTQPINWGNQGIPAAVWSGPAIDLSKNGGLFNTPTAGARRLAWPTNSPSGAATATSTLWQVATVTDLMQMGETEGNLIRYFDNGCEGARSAVNISVINRPTTDLIVDEPVVNEGCNLSSAEPIEVTVHNYGAQATTDVILKYSLDGGTTIACIDTLPGLASRTSVTHTFSNTINMHTSSDTIFNIKVWVDAVTGDFNHTNDTNQIAVLSNYSPDVPYVVSPRSVEYDDTLHLSAIGNPSSDWLIWYNSALNPIDTTPGSYITPNIYHPDTFYYRAIALKDLATTHVGTLASEANNAFPSPYSPKQRYVKEQYLYTAQQIADAGHSAGTISSLAFYLNSVNVPSFTFDYYTIKMGTTTSTTFANGNFVTGLNQVFTDSNFTLTPDNVGWVTHLLDTPFNWDGTSNIVIEVVRGLNAAGINNASSTRYTSQANTVITKQHNTTDQSTATSGSKGGNRPDLLIGFLEPVGCMSDIDTVLVEVTGTPDVDASITWDDEGAPCSGPGSFCPAVQYGTGNTSGVFNSCGSNSMFVRISNNGNDTLTNYTLRYKVDNNPWVEHSGYLNNLTLGYSARVELLSEHFTPGRHTITAVVSLSGDTITSNDTIRRTINVRFCAGDYIVGTCPNADFPTITTALDTLHNAGVNGAVVFRLCEETFNEQLNLTSVPGASATNTITFKTIQGATDMAQITYTPTNAANYVLDMNGVNYITFDSIYFYANYTSGSGNNVYANVVSVLGSSNIAFRHSVLRSKKTTASSTNANVVLLGDENYFITFDHCIIDSGYYGIRTRNNTKSENIFITNSEISNFWFQGIHLRNIDTVSIMTNNIHAGVATNGKPLTGIYLTNITRAGVQRNLISLIDDATGGKRGIVLNRCRGTNMDRVTVYNNMISLNGTAVASLASSGIWIDSLSRNLSVFYNTARLYAGPTQATTRTFSCQNSSQVQVLNNIFDNASKGFAYYVAVDTCVSSSNYNVYYSNSDTNAAGVRNFVHWGVSNCNYLDSLRAVNGKDQNSIESLIYYVNEPYDLKCRTAQFSDSAQYNPDITLDVFGNIRPQIPQPTIGAHEFNAQRALHDVAVAKIYLPYVPAVTTGNNPTVLNIETDSIDVLVTFFNNGNAEETCTWYAYMGNLTPAPISITQTITIGVQDSLQCTVKVPSPLGIVDTQDIVVVITPNAPVVDLNPADNRDTAQVFLYPAYDLQVVAVALDSTIDPNHCRMFAVPIRYTIKNAGKKDFPTNFQFSLGYDYYCHQPNNLTMPNFPGSSTCPYINWTSALPVGITRDTVIAPECRPNLYPTGYLQDITVRLRGWVTHEFDVKPLNDTTNYVSFTSNHTPDMPVPSDTSINYGSYGNLWATQSENRVIRWHRDDTVSGTFFYNGNNNPVRSTHWNTTPQYFHDSCYYLSAVSSRGCTSYYSQICVSVNPPLQRDVSISKVISPRASGRVYVENDTVTLQVINYGSTDVTTIPIHFEWLSSNGRTVLDSITDTVRINMANHGYNGLRGRVGDVCDTFNFSFPHLLSINQPLSNTTYKLNAWVMLPGDQERGNDTLRTLHTFKTLAETIYDSINHLAPDEVAGFDIKRVSFNELDNEMPDMIGYDNLWLGGYNASNAEIPTLVVRKGTTDTLSIEVANNNNEMDSSTAASLFVIFDYNRDGQFDFNNYENILKGGGLFSTVGVKVNSRQTFQKVITIPPEAAQYGYLRMLVLVDGDSTTFVNGITANKLTNGQLQQYMVYITEDQHLDTVDAALTRVSSPRNHILRDTPHSFTFMLANKGLTPLTSATIDYSFNDYFHPAQTGTINWSGNLDPGLSQLVSIDDIRLYKGTTDFTATVNVLGDTFHVGNNTLQYRYHIYDTVELRFIDSFDQLVSKWYIPAGYNNYTRNYFVRATPTKTTISSAYSQPNAFVTSATETIVTGKHGNRSIIYTPIISIRQIRPDTITLLLSKNMAAGSYLTLEYRDYMGNWVKVEDPNIRWVPDEDHTDYHWYDELDGWTGTSLNGAYVGCSIPSSLISGDFGQDLQFRFVYTTPVTSSPASAFGDGVAIDNFVIGRARRSRDIGITQMTYPTNPQFGQTIYPKVIVHNYGLDSINEFQIQYKPYGVHLYILDTARLEEPLRPDTSIEYTFTHPFIITSAFPDTFQICATTSLSGDIYRDNDSICDIFHLTPLANDLQLYGIASPGDHAVAGDSLYITLRLRNFGQTGIDSCRVTYVYNGGEPVVETVNFHDYLGRPLASTEIFNYTFRRRERATMGTMQLQAWCNYEYDSYPYNDTLSKSIAGLTIITDIAATAGIIDQRDFENVYMSIVLDNVGGLAANNFTVGFWYDNNRDSCFSETYYREGGLPAGGHDVFTFHHPLRLRTAAWNYLTVWVSVPGDINSENDTTDVIQDYYYDLSLDAIEIEENMSDRCRLRAVVTNHGNINYYGVMRIDALINGNPRVRRNIEAFSYDIDPGETRRIPLIGSDGNYLTIPKSPTRTYIGSALVDHVSGDADDSNNQTTVMRVINYFEDVPVVHEPDFVLEQNYPNPYDGSTRIEFSLPTAGNTHFTVTDVIGRVVYEEDGYYSDGRHTINFDKGNLPSGVYYYSLEFNGQRRMHKMIIK
jgi:hypothetical protein